jgi:uncharacterized membrane protein
MENKQFKILLAYLFGWISGLILLLVEKDDEIRHHAAQSFVVFFSLTILSIIISILAFLLFPLRFIFDIFSLLISLAGFILWIYFLIKVVIGEYPVIHNELLQKWVKKVENSFGK